VHEVKEVTQDNAMKDVVPEKEVKEVEESTKSTENEE